MPSHATALFAERHAAHAAVEQLVQAGFPRDAISVVLSETAHEREFGAPTSERSESSGVRSSRPSSGVFRAILSNLVELACPCGLPLRAAGPLVAALLREGAGGTFSAALAAAGVGPDQARFIDRGVHGGSIVVGVQAGNDRARLAMQLLELSGGEALAA
ncbi:MAG TPA: hypothetical protein VE987_09845 [Polyangiaceae bacterium]|nr:hypothetical protein [Polyangiaceae bacterium]